MKSIIAGVLLSFALTSSLYAQGKTEFSKIWDAGFDTYQQAEDELSAGEKDRALKSFKSALEQFNKISSADLTSWQEKIINYRIGLCRSNIEAIVRSINTGSPVVEVAVPTTEPDVQRDNQKAVVELEALKKQRQSIEDTLKIYIDKYNQEVTGNETLKLDLIDATKEVQKLKAMNKVLTQKLASSDKELQAQIIKSSKKLETRVKNYETRINELKASLEKKSAEKEKIQTYVDTKEAEYDKLSEKLDLMQVEVKNLKGAIQTKESAIKSLKTKVQTLESNLGATKETTARTNEYVSSQKLYITKLTNEVASLKEALKSTKKLLKDSETKVETGSKENFQLKMFLQEKINEKNELATTVAELDKTLASVKKNLQDTKNELKAVTEQGNETSNIVSQKNNEIKQLNSIVKTKEASIVELTSKYTKQQSDYTSLKAQSAKSTALAASQQKLITELQQQLLEQERNLADKDKIISNKENALSQGVASTSKLKEAMQVEVNEKESIKATLAKLLEEKAAQAENIIKLRAEIEKHQQNKRLFDDQISRGKDELSRAKADANKLKIDLAKVKMDLSTKDVDIAILNEQIISLQNKLNIKEATPLISSKPKPQESKTGTLYRIRSKSTYVTHALVDANRRPLCYVHFSTPATQYEGKQITITGRLRAVKGWKAPILDASNIIAQ